MNDTERLTAIVESELEFSSRSGGKVNVERIVGQLSALLDEARAEELQNLVDGNWKEHGDIYYTALKRISTLTQKQEN